MEGSHLFPALRSLPFTDVLEPSCPSELETFYEPVAISPPSADCNPSCGSHNPFFDTVHSPSCQNLRKSSSYESYQLRDAYTSENYRANRPTLAGHCNKPIGKFYSRWYDRPNSGKSTVVNIPGATHDSCTAEGPQSPRSPSYDSFGPGDFQWPRPSEEDHSLLRHDATSPYLPEANYHHRPVRNHHSSRNNDPKPPSPPPSGLAPNNAFLPFEANSLKTQLEAFQQMSSRHIFPPKSPPTMTTPTTLPTPPQSPPSSGSEEDLERLLRVIPEIIELVPPLREEALPGVEDILRDIEAEGVAFAHFAKRLFSLPSTAAPLQQQQKGRGEDSRDSVGPQIKSKLRTVSESSEEQQAYPSVYSDEEFGPLPDTPYGSDEDGERTTTETSPCPSPVSARPTSTGPTSTFEGYSPLQYSSITSDHDYCDRRTVQRTPYSGFTDTAAAAAPPPPPPPEESSPATSTSPSTAVPSSPSAQVKRHLQLLLHESIRNKQKRTRAPRPPKDPHGAGDDAWDGASSSAPSPEDSSSSDSSGRSPQKGRTIGKPASYTKRMREQHCEVLKTTKRRKTAARDPDDDLEKRSNHNIMERNRRVNIKNLFDDLRRQVPEIQANERASKVHILKKSREYIRQMQCASSELEVERAALSQRHQHLKKKLQQALRNAPPGVL